MSNELEIISSKSIQNRIYTLRGVQVMLDNELARLYNVETKYLNRAVKRNIERFPESFRFQLTQTEYDEILRFQIGTSSLDSQDNDSNLTHGGRRYFPFVFTEQGVGMLSAVLRSETAVQVSIQIMQAFVSMKRFISTNAGIFQRLDKIEEKQMVTDHNFEKVFQALENRSITPKQGIFYDGQVFDAYTFTSDLIRSAKKSIILIDNYIDDSVLKLFTKSQDKATVTIYTKAITSTLAQDVKKYNSQYPKINLKLITKTHDRFLIIDNSELYHFGASIKDLGKKWFAFSKLEMDPEDIISKLGKGKI
jgi:hypothetical protein